jgi:protein SCO1/2
MQGIIKSVILGVTLILPVLIFLFLKTAGRNEYDLEVFSPEAPGCTNYQQNGVHQVPAFVLTDQNGSRFESARQTEGKLYVAGFFFTRCTTICPAMASELNRLMEKFSGHPSVHLAMFSVDPENDQPERLQQWATAMGLQYPNVSLLTGDKTTIYEMAQCQYFVQVKENPQGDEPFYHGDTLILVDKNKKIRGFYAATDRQEMDRLIIELQVLLYQEGEI